MPKSQEFLDIVDNNNNIIGKKSRQEVHEKNLNHRASHIVIAYENYVYLQLRSAHKQQFPNKWDISAAGHVTSRSSYYDTALRELKEELNLDLTNNSILEIGEIAASIETGYEFIKIYYYKYDYLPQIILEPIEITTGGWFAVDHISNWLKKQPQDFAGCFELVWHVFIKTTAHTLPRT